MLNFASKDLTVGQLNALVKKVGGHENVLGILSGSIKFHLLSGAPSLEQTLTLSGESIPDLITAGNYDWFNSQINQNNFPLNLSLDGEWEWDLYNPSSRGSQEVFDEMSVDGWMPASIFHLLVFGAKYPEAQKVNPIAGLGSSCHDVFDDRDVPVLSSDDGRGLGLGYWGGVWDSDDRFLRVRRLVA